MAPPPPPSSSSSSFRNPSADDSEQQQQQQRQQGRQRRRQQQHREEEEEEQRQQQKRHTGRSSSSSSSSSSVFTLAALLLLSLCVSAYLIAVPVAVVVVKHHINNGNNSEIVVDPVAARTTKTKTTTTTSSKKKKGMCVSKEPDLSKLIGNSDNNDTTTTTVTVLMPAKVAGVAFSIFVEKCTGTSRGEAIATKKRSKNQDGKEAFLTRSYDLPAIASRHVGRDLGPELEMMKHASSSRNLIIWLHRDETDRLISAIRQVLKVACRPRDYKKRSYDLDVGDDGVDAQPLPIVDKSIEGRCVVRETDLIRRVIIPKRYEIGNSNGSFLTCETYDVLRRNLPNMIFVDYRQTNLLQEELAARHCPDVLKDLPLTANVARKMEIFVDVGGDDEEGDNDVGEEGGSRGNKRSIGGSVGGSVGGGERRRRLVYLDDWLDRKGSHLEMTLGLTEDGSCLSTTRRLEDALGSCEDRMVRIDEEWIG